MWERREKELAWKTFSRLESRGEFCPSTPIMVDMSNKSFLLIFPDCFTLFADHGWMPSLPTWRQRWYQINNDHLCDLEIIVFSFSMLRVAKTVTVCRSVFAQPSRSMAAAAASDPIQKIYLDKLNEYVTKSKLVLRPLLTKVLIYWTVYECIDYALL